MTSLETTFMGLNLKNPIVVSSSGLTNSVEKIKKLEENGAGAVILKSLFEEQINHEAGKLAASSDYPEAEDYILNYTKSNSVSEYLKLIIEAKKEVSIPIIASINCVSSDEWISFAKEIEEAGADGIELNVFVLPTDKFRSSTEMENIYLELGQKIRSLVKIPIAMKLGQNFTNLLDLTNKLEGIGINSVTMFNRFYQPDIDIDNMKLTSAEVFSTSADLRFALRWIGIISAKLNILDIAASTGVHDGKAAVKMLLAGADAVQVCSVLYKNGPEFISTILNEMKDWMESKGFEKINDFKAKLNYKEIKDPSVYERSQFMKYFSSIQ